MAKTPDRVVELLNSEIPRKISRNKFCNKTGINVNSIDKYFAGNTEPTQASLEKLALYFNVSVAWLRGESTDILDGVTSSGQTELKITNNLAKEIIEMFRGEGGTIQEKFADSVRKAKILVSGVEQMAGAIKRSTPFLYDNRSS